MYQPSKRCQQKTISSLPLRTLSAISLSSRSWGRNGRGGQTKTRRVRSTMMAGMCHRPLSSGCDDGTDLYWARSRVLEYLSGMGGKLPQGVTRTVITFQSFSEGVSFCVRDESVGCAGGCRNSGTSPASERPAFNRPGSPDKLQAVTCPMRFTCLLLVT